MNRYTGQPNYALVFDVNTLIDAVDQSSKHHDSAVRSLSCTKLQPVYFSDHMLSTTSHELLRLGARPKVVQEYLEFITVPEDEFDIQAQTFERIDFYDYDIRDRYGNPDREDATIVSLMDAAEEHAELPALLVTTDGGLQEWCVANRRDVVFPNRLPQILDQHEDRHQASTLDYVARRMFPNGKQNPKLESTPQLRQQAKETVHSIRDSRDAYELPQPPRSLFDDPTAVNRAMADGAAKASLPLPQATKSTRHTWTPNIDESTKGDDQSQPGS